MGLILCGFLWACPPILLDNPSERAAAIASINPGTTPNLLLEPSLPEVATSTLPKGIECLCTAFACTLIPSIPYPMNADELVSNGTGDLGNGIIFHYPSGIAHIAVILGFAEDGWKVVEANREHCQISYRTVRYDDKNIYGFIKA